MKRLNMVAYGFVRSKEDDFNDDGNIFRCYRVGNNMRVSVCTQNGEAWISARVEKPNIWLRYEDYSKLEHYRDLDKLNRGVRIDTLQEQDLIDLYNSCLAYEKEYEELEKEIESKLTLTKEDIDLFNDQVDHYEKLAYLKVKKIILDNFDALVMNSNQYSFKKVMEYAQALYKKAYIEAYNKIECNNIKKANRVYYARFGFQDIQNVLIKIKEETLENNFYIDYLKGAVEDLIS